MRSFLGALTTLCVALLAGSVAASTFDGDWNGSLRCAPSLLNQGKTAAFSNPISMEVVGSSAKIVRDTEVVTEVYTGEIAGNGRSSLKGAGKYKSNSRPAVWTAKIDGQFADVQFEGVGEIFSEDGKKIRECTVKLVKNSVHTPMPPAKASATNATSAIQSAYPVDQVTTPVAVAQNQSSIQIDAKAFIGRPYLMQESAWSNPKSVIFGKLTVDWNEQDFQRLEQKLSDQIAIERKDIAEQNLKSGLKTSPDEDSIFKVSKKYLEDAITAIPKFIQWTELARDKLRTEATQRAAVEQGQRAEEAMRAQQYLAREAEVAVQQEAASGNQNLLVALAVVFVGAGTWYWSKFIRNRCPKCKSAGYDKVSVTETDRWVGNKTVHEKHSRGTNTRNVRTTYVKKLYEFRCKSCQTTWSKERKEDLDGVSALELLITGF